MTVFGVAFSECAAQRTRSVGRSTGPIRRRSWRRSSRPVEPLELADLFGWDSLEQGHARGRAPADVHQTPAVAVPPSAEFAGIPGAVDEDLDVRAVGWQVEVLGH